VICDALSAAKSPRSKIHALVPGLIPGIEDAYPYNETLLYDLVLAIAIRLAEFRIKIVLLFKSAGTVAAATQYYRKSDKFPDIPETISLASFCPRDGPRDGKPLIPPDALGIVVNPVNSRGDPVILDIASMVGSCATSCEWILFNPDFTADRSALGVAEVSRRNAFLETFEDVFYLRNLFAVSRPSLEATERGAVMRVYPAPWKVFALDKLTGSYCLISTHDMLPPRNRIADAFDVAPSRPLTVEEKFGRYSADDRSYLATLVSLSVLASAMFYVSRVVGRL
jgi:Domain of unknown function (DUF1995)